jgi:hypothetical protein
MRHKIFQFQLIINLEGVNMKLKALAALAIVLFLTLFAAVCFGTKDQSAPSVFFPQTSFEFPAALDGAKVEHTFVIQNKGTATLKVERVKTG